MIGTIQVVVYNRFSTITVLNIYIKLFTSKQHLVLYTRIYVVTQVYITTKVTFDSRLFRCYVISKMLKM